jgi:hypothetical protein
MIKNGIGGGNTITGLNAKKLAIKKIKENPDNSVSQTTKLLKLIIEVYGHAWCLDNDLEVNKLVKLIDSNFELITKK